MDEKQSQLKSKYKSKIFIGCFKEKRYCDAIKCYRDVIEISRSEKEFSKDLDDFMIEIKEHSRNQMFVGVTKAEESITIWTELEEGTAFGKYWFQVKTVKFRFNEIQIKLKTLRSIEDDEPKTYAEKLRGATNVTAATEDVEWRILYDFWKRELSAAVAWVLSVAINRQTVTETLRFFSLIIVSIFAGSTKIIKYLGIFTIKLIERTTWLAHVLTPFAMGVLDLISKIVGGFYLLIAMIWRDSVGAPRRPLNNAIEAGQRQKQESILYKKY